MLQKDGTTSHGSHADEAGKLFGLVFCLFCVCVLLDGHAFELLLGFSFGYIVCHGQAWEDEGEQEYEAEAGTGQVSDCKSSVYSGLSKVKCEDEQADYEESVGCL